MTKAKQDTNTDAPTKILIDYQGQIGRAPGQPQVKHIRSPLISVAYVPGVKTLNIHPGLNLVDTALWEKHQHLSQIRDRLADRQLRRVNSLDSIDLIGLIERTVDTAALEWLLEQEKAKDEPADDVVNMIEMRLANSIPVESIPTTFTQNTAAA